MSTEKLETDHNQIASEGAKDYVAGSIEHGL